MPHHPFCRLLCATTIVMTACSGYESSKSQKPLQEELTLWFGHKKLIEIQNTSRDASNLAALTPTPVASTNTFSEASGTSQYTVNQGVNNGFEPVTLKVFYQSPKFSKVTYSVNPGLSGAQCNIQRTLAEYLTFAKGFQNALTTLSQSYKKANLNSDQKSKLLLETEASDQLSTLANSVSSQESCSIVSAFQCLTSYLQNLTRETLIAAENQAKSKEIIVVKNEEDFGQTIVNCVSNLNLSKLPAGDKVTPTPTPNSN